MQNINIYKKHKKDNICFIEINSPYVFKNTISIQYNIGSIDDIENKEGLTHLVEHCLVSSIDNVFLYKKKEIQDINTFAYTYKDRTFYSLSSSNLSIKETFEEFMRYLNFNISENTIKKEKQIIQNEILQDKEDKYKQIYNKFISISCKYVAGIEKYNHDIKGDKKSLSNININDIKKHIQKNLKDGTIVFLTKSALTDKDIENVFDQILNSALKSFSEKEIQRNKHITKTDIINNQIIVAKKIQFKYKNTYIYGLAIKKRFDRDDVVYINILRRYLANNWSSIINQKLRIEKNIIYYAYSDFDIYKDFAFIYAYFDSDKKNDKNIKKEMKIILNDLYKGNLDKDIFLASKSINYSNALSIIKDEWELSNDFCYSNRNVFDDNLYTLENYLSDIKKTNFEDFTNWIKILNIS